MEDTELDKNNKKKETLIETIDKLIKKHRKNKALISLKYDDISCKINFVQVSVIIVSTAITFLGTIKSKYNINEDIATLLPIIFSTYIALILAIVRFLKLDEKKEDISKTIQNFNFIINKLRKTLNVVKTFDLCPENFENWKNVCSNYENETYDFIVTNREAFDNIMPFKEVNYYKKKYRKILLDYRLVNNEIQMIDKNHNNVNQLKYKHKEHWIIFIFRRLFCCRRRKILYDNFIEDVENLLNEDDEELDSNFSKKKVVTI